MSGFKAPEGSVLPAATAALVSLSAALASRDEAIVDEALRRASERAPVPAVEEALLQSYLFLGYPVALNAFARWREVSGRSPGPPVPDDWSGWVARGAEVCSRVYADQYEGLRENVRRLHPDMERWMVAEGYGKVLGRPGLDLHTRELCIAALLAVLGVPRQLYSHLRGALNCGASPDEIEAALSLAITLADDRATAVARETWTRVRDRAAARVVAGDPDRSETGPE